MILRELKAFLIVGILTVLIDFLTYRAIVWTAWLDIDMAKAAGFLAGTVFAYFANKKWTFDQREHAPGSAWRFIPLYAITLGANVWVNSMCLSLLHSLPGSIQMSFLFATAMSAALNFLGMKLYVFKAHTTKERS
ncbi:MULTISPECIES: GtrA family protein [Pseudomonas]|jgi:putative flippase GtrA|uniref:GtrA family protein n=1 Tax=Pseudomonas TaxID=286 RepID=UPI0015AD8687|nr:MULTISPECIES: GtrA family protein [Pseudomonas]MCI9875261.1 GtrA family protein [Pseudomonas atacamensis]